jgi:hypothetical protein
LALGRDELRKQNSVKLLARFNFDRIKCNQSHARFLNRKKKENQSISGHVVVIVGYWFVLVPFFQPVARRDV